MCEIPSTAIELGIKNYRVNFYVFPVHTVSLFLALILENFLNKTLFIAIIYHFIYVLDNPAFYFNISIGQDSIRILTYAYIFLI